MMKRQKKNILRDCRGELAYIGTAVTTLIILIVLAFILNIFSFLTIKQDMEYMCEQLVETAACAGSTDGRTFERLEELCGELGFDVSCVSLSFDGSDYMPGSSTLVQYGDTLSVTVTYRKQMGGFGVLDMPVSLTCTCSGISEKYHK